MLTPPAAAAAESGLADPLAMRGRCRIAPRRVDHHLRADAASRILASPR